MVATELERKLSELDCPFKVEVRTRACKRIPIVEERALTCYLRVVSAGFYWWFMKGKASHYAAIRAHSWRWTFAGAEGETFEESIVLAFERACDVFPGLRGTSYDRTVRQVTI